MTLLDLVQQDQEGEHGQQEEKGEDRPHGEQCTAEQLAAFLEPTFPGP